MLDICVWKLLCLECPFYNIMYLQCFGDNEIENVNEDEEEPSSNDESEKKAMKLYVFFLLLFQTLFRCSDTAISILLKLLLKFVRILGLLFSCEQLMLFAAKLPTSVKNARSVAGNTRGNFQKFACCRKCFSIYEWNPSTEPLTLTCILMLNFLIISNFTIGNIVVKTLTGKEIYRPLSVFCYRSIIQSLQELLLRPNFITQCAAWRKRDIPQGVYCDVYDGKIWQDFMDIDGIPFLSVPFNFALQLNVDWFQPFTHTTHSEGVIYLSVMNLPRCERFLQKNTILVGIIPGPHEPKKTINSFLSPMVDDLLKLWRGVMLKFNSGQNAPVLVRAALLCAGWDIPAARKTCGFVGHNARLACSKCLLEFPTEEFGKKPDFSNFDTTQWTTRTNSQHRESAEKHRLATTKTEMKRIERDTGVRYSVLLKLPYFNAPRMCIIDPMHNLFLGTAQKMIQLWKEDILPREKFQEIQKKVDSYVTPRGVCLAKLKLDLPDSLRNKSRIGASFFPCMHFMDLFLAIERTMNDSME